MSNKLPRNYDSNGNSPAIAASNIILKKYPSLYSPQQYCK
jgi:hypothetical protein